jgi:hypothetical protein
VRKIELVERQLLDADDLADVLVVAWEIFGLVGGLAADCADRAPDMYPAFMFARGAAVNGRNAVASAPSMPPGRSVLAESSKPSATDMYEVADAIAGLASALGARLREAARLADDGDRIACQNAARDADRIVGLLAESA